MYFGDGMKMHDFEVVCKALSIPYMSGEDFDKKWEEFAGLPKTSFIVIYSNDTSGHAVFVTAKCFKPKGQTVNVRLLYRTMESIKTSHNVMIGSNPLISKIKSGILKFTLLIAVSYMMNKMYQYDFIRDISHDEKRD